MNSDFDVDDIINKLLAARS